MQSQSGSQSYKTRFISCVLVSALCLLLMTTALWAQPIQPVRATASPFPELIFADSPLLEAVAKGDVEAVKAALEKNPASVNTLHKLGYTPLGVALRAGHKELAQLLLDKGADISLGRANNAPLMQAVQSGKTELVQLLLDKGLDINESNANGGYTILFWPMQSDNKEMFEFLIQKGADVNGKKVLSYSPYYVPLHQAITTGKKDYVQILLKHGANVNPTTGYLPLMSAIQQGNREIVQMLLASGADVNATPAANYYGSNASSPLQYAMQGGRREIVELMIDKADLKAYDRRGYTLLHTAVQAGQKFIVELLLQKGVDINAKTHVGDTPLHLAVTNAAGVLPTLLERQANPNLRNGRGDTPLHMALRSSRKDAETALVPKSSLTINDQYGLSPLLLAIVNRRTEARDLILERKPKMDKTLMLFDAAAQNDVPVLTGLLKEKPFLAFTRLGNGMTPLHIAALWGAGDAVTLLLKKGLDVNAKDAEARTPLHLVLQRNGSGDLTAKDALATADLLMQKGADINGLDTNESAPLHKAVLSQDKELVELLLNKGANVNVRDKTGSTPLHLVMGSAPAGVASSVAGRRRPANAAAVRANPVRGTVAKTNAAAASIPDATNQFALGAAKLLLQKGADVNARDTTGETPLVKATARTGTRDLVALLLDKGAQVNPKGNFGDTPLAKALTSNNMEVARFLIEKGADVNARTRSNYGENSTEPLLLRVMNNNNIEAAKLLIEKGADVNVTGNNNETPMGRAINNNNLELIRLILDKGADLKASVYYGESALHRAISYANKELITLLLDKKLDINMRDNSGNTPLIRAVTQGNKDIVTLLLDKGADVNIKNTNGQSALAHAVFYRNSPEIIDLLKERGAKE